MDLQTQKLHLIEEVLHLDNSEQVAQLTNFLAVLKQEDFRDLDDIPSMPPRSAEELRVRLEQSLRESREGKGIPHEEARAMMLRRFR